ncbi:MAG: protein kinase [Planctomycetota bacterium]
MAQHTESKDYVLLRVYPLKGSYSGEFSKLATRGERACRVQHPQLASALGAGKAGDCFFVGAPPPLGKRLSTILAEGEPLDPKALETLLADVGAALGALHQRQLVHANVSPDTIRLHEGRWYLHEAGLSRPRSEFDFLSAGGEVLGDPGFIAPETVDSGEQTSASDLYALGCVAWTALSLEPPFKGDDPVQVLLDQLNVDVPPVKGVEGKPPAPEPLLTIVGKLCGYTPSVRYSASRELLTDLKGLERGDVPSPFGQDLRQDEQDRAPEKLSSSRTLVIVLAALNVMALVALGFFAWQYSQIEYKDPLDAFSLPDLTQAPAAPSGE